MGVLYMYDPTRALSSIFLLPFLSPFRLTLLLLPLLLLAFFVS